MYHVGGMIHRLHNLLCRQENIRFPGAEQIEAMTGSHGYVLCWLVDHEKQGPVYQRDIEKELMLRRSSATETLQLMEKNGLIIRMPEPGDQRLKRLQTTEKAEKVYRMLVSGIEDIEQRLVAGVTPQELETLITVLGKIRANLDKGLFADEGARPEPQQNGGRKTV